MFCINYFQVQAKREKERREEDERKEKLKQERLAAEEVVKKKHDTEVYILYITQRKA